MNSRKKFGFCKFLLLTQILEMRWKSIGYFIRAPFIQQDFNIIVLFTLLRHGYRNWQLRQTDTSARPAGPETSKLERQNDF